MLTNFKIGDKFKIVNIEDCLKESPDFGKRYRNQAYYSNHVFTVHSNPGVDYKYIDSYFTGYGLISFNPKHIRKISKATVIL